MKKITSILSAVLLLTLGVSSCMDDFDTPVTGNAYGNNTINEQRTITTGRRSLPHRRWAAL